MSATMAESVTSTRSIGAPDDLCGRPAGRSAGPRPGAPGGGSEPAQGTEKHPRTPARTGYRTGDRDRPGETRVGTIARRVPRGREGSVFPSLGEPRTRAERPRAAVVQEVYVPGARSAALPIWSGPWEGRRPARGWSSGSVRSGVPRWSAAGLCGWQGYPPLLVGRHPGRLAGVAGACRDARQASGGARGCGRSGPLATHAERDPGKADRTQDADQVPW